VCGTRFIPAPKAPNQTIFSAPQREHAPAVVAHDRQARHGERLGAVALGEDERAGERAARAGVVGVGQLGDACCWGCFVFKEAVV